MAQNLKNKIALVTGASKGIGVAIAQTLAARGATVAVNYFSDQEGADRVVRAIEAAGGQAIAVQAHVGKPEEVDRMIETIRSRFGRIDILVNNAGRFKLDNFETADADSYTHNFETNVLGLLLVTQGAVPLFPETGGSIVNIGSATAKMPNTQVLTYGASKAAHDHLTRTLALALGPRNIRVNSVNPGVTETEGAHVVGSMTREFQAAVVTRTPLGRIGQPIDIAEVVAFMASDQAGWITGELVGATGGLY